ncbi:metallophosphoesterase [Methanocaldococcus infernus ME]|uniref:Metallophosphoesterase n=1 Tax=Methanocaldococcus infernus (strain DSM 11812 / JCM 15783 / ME) TaxID=573063 RepID=D5VQL2_METIM|nr:metallophosphoesterase [Methanocaldococcus infernus]ADG12865.1 metallophosphoesterase [Methanocaldococcus infernus ME]
MNIYGITDLHGRFPSRIREMRDKIDVLIVSGDITHFGEGLEVIEKLAELSDYMEVLCVPGNCDNLEVVDLLEEYKLNVDGRVKKIENYNFVGIGGSNETPFNTPLEFSEEDLYDKGKKLCKGLKNIILITHAPPYGTMLDLVGEKHVGSKAIRKIIEEENVIFNACGHIHECRGIDKIGKTIIVNPSPKSFFVYQPSKRVVILEDYIGL